MYKVFKKIGLLVFSCIVSFAAFAMEDFHGRLPTADLETAQLARTYRGLSLSYNNNTNLQTFNDAFTEFENGIFFPVPQNNTPTNAR